MQDDGAIDSINNGDSTPLKNKHSALLLCCYCLVEDFMVLSKNTNVSVLMSLKLECELLQQDSFWSLADSNSIVNYQSIIQFKNM